MSGEITKIDSNLEGYRAGQPDDHTEQIAVEITRRQIGDRMASDYYITFDGQFTVPYRQLESLMEHGAPKINTLTPWQDR